VRGEEAVVALVVAERFVQSNDVGGVGKDQLAERNHRAV